LIKFFEVFQGPLSFNAGYIAGHRNLIANNQRKGFVKVVRPYEDANDLNLYKIYN